LIDDFTLQNYGIEKCVVSSIVMTGVSLIIMTVGDFF